MPPKREPKGLKLKVNLVAKVVGPLVRDLGFHPIRGLQKELWGPRENFP